MVKSRETCSGASSSHNVSAGRGASFKAGSAHRPVAPKLSVLADAFFSGKIRDNTTPAACNAAKKLAILGNKNKNPEWSPLDSKGNKVNVNSIDVSKAKTAIGNSMPSSILNNLVRSAGGCASSSSASGKGKKQHKRDPVHDDVVQDIRRRIEVLCNAGQQFEEGAAYIDSEEDAINAGYIVQGIDPACMKNQASGVLVARRVIPVERRHWVATMRGLFRTQHGTAYIHTDGSITMLSSGRETVCRCIQEGKPGVHAAI